MAGSPQPCGILGGQASLDAYRAYLDAEPQDLEPEPDESEEQLSLWPEADDVARAA